MRTDLKVTFDVETDGRWIADIPALPGVMVYGRTREAARAAVEALAVRVIEDRLTHGEDRMGRKITREHH